ncbi:MULTISPECIES: tetratricopeptide repeat protein [unclassified Rhodococcus (in: high G+C Gram-positive bacteria)]|jgi:putative thioredoxin|uniref:tetratricopeptide repeat protein n=1 Tax=unclassified Rhodococcus (in: high G+C Gram-positive bacteria) TaxID=192944 RepID=UPI00146C03CE|nr:MULTISPECIES: tetratricopeptide repeat protein [unclassified Rhodococcus (in: high G+C Gram-positive bacteria)]MBF0660375.1 tetratricopeptide repeat protein [Rhodococcus sp. (in: high G+C Gram-positive bacteria)]NMD95090.1 tetratricopeptide repeat protein [Rhodococcus sp. BL-253-APC-6A1W]NME81190.1 tetratricopeptide repeat protein [Rhodococcus sp. 105337]
MSGAVDLAPLKARATAPPPPPPSAGASGAIPSIIDVTEATFEAEVLERSMQVPVIVDLWATWCEPCKQLTPSLEKLAAEAGGEWVLAKVDVDANPRIAQAFGVQSVPTVVAIAAGQPLADFQGVQPEAALRQWLDAIREAVAGKLSGPPSADGEPAEQPVDPRFEAAEQALEQGDFEGAEAAYRLILNSEPNNTDAQAALRQVRFLGRAQQLPADAVERADAAPADLDAQLAAADAELFAQDPEAAFARLIEFVRRSAGDERTAARTRLLELFELFDPAEDFVVSARRKLAMALY